MKSTMNRRLLLVALAVCFLSPGASAVSADAQQYARMPWHLVDLWWDLGKESPFQSYSIDVTISDDVPSTTNLYIAPIGIAHLNKIPFYGGIQTQADGNTKSDRLLRKIGPGFLMSMWGERSLEAIRKSKDGSISIEVGEPVEGRTDRRVEIDPTEVGVGSQADKRSQTSQLGKKTPPQILAMLGAKGEAGAHPDKLDEYRRIFGFLDADNDGNLSTKEFIEDGRYMTREARQGIFTASDANSDGIVSEQEYVTNRIITDEAKAIMAKMDKDGGGTIARGEFIEHSGLPEDLSNAVFNEFDTDGNGELMIPEYLRVWGRWARSKDVDE